MNDAKQSLLNIEQLMQRYFDGLYYSDVSLLASVFHPNASYITATSGELVQLSMGEYYELVNHRPAPASVNQKRDDRIVAIEFIGDNSAMVNAACTIKPKHFSDRLSLIKLDNKWQIISKIFHYDIDQTTEE